MNYYVPIAQLGHFIQTDTWAYYRAWVLWETWCNPYERKLRKDSIYTRKTK